MYRRDSDTNFEHLSSCERTSSFQKGYSVHRDQFCALFTVCFGQQYNKQGTVALFSRSESLQFLPEYVGG